MIFNITALYASLSAFLLLHLTVKVIRLQRSEKTGLGSNGSESLQRAIRAHGNFTEYAPLVLVLLLIAESAQLPSLFLHGIGGFFLLGRILHQYGITKVNETLKFRVCGMLLTLSTLLVLGTITMLIFLKEGF